MENTHQNRKESLIKSLQSVETQPIPHFIIELWQVFQRPGIRDLFLAETEEDILGVARYDTYRTKPCLLDGIAGDSAGVARSYGPPGLGASIASAISENFKLEDSMKSPEGIRRRLYCLKK